MAQWIGCDPGADPDTLDEWAALEALSALVDKSLVQASSSDPPRYHLLESTRDYALERLAESGESSVARQRHAHAMVARFGSAQSEAEVLRDSEWLPRYLPERDNLRAALTWACGADEPDTLAMLIAALQQIDYFILVPNSVLEFDIPLKLLERATPAKRAMACVEFGWAHYVNGSRERATELSVQALDAARMADDKAVEYRSVAQLARLYRSRPGLGNKAVEMRSAFSRFEPEKIPARTRFVGMLIFRMSELTATSDQFTELQDIAKRAGFDTLASICSILITNAFLEESRFEDAVDSARRFIGAGETRPRPRAMILSNLAEALMQLGRIDDALDAAQSALRAYPDAMLWLADTLACGAITQGRVRDAALMAGYGEAASRKRGHLPDPAEAKLRAENDARLRESLPADEFERLRRAGASMTGAALFGLALPRSAA